MSIELTYGDITLPLDKDLYWADEFKYSPVDQTVDDSVDGSLIIQVDGDASRPGRPITLQPEDDTSAWMIRADIEQLQAWSAIPGAEFQLLLRGVGRTVIFRNHEKPAVDAKPVTHFSDVESTDFYLVTLKFLEIS